ncbi:nucleotidyltransferase domain-containing protein [Alkalihalobacillus oceani]|uniref:nucleotidyltransferase domain-containing protein n=1 Tax=Halalkalibacter oceani TaxID=1653776 RepID=UPI0020426A3E|nr:nucleotidyltransferase domain-containing protein [Halalkalibacter oceani]MCM3761606.1 nucleotidyltransferase domain-containing protein [Halalkalibacter oceani]
MLLQEKVITKIKEKCQSDPHICACMMYGSFTKGEGDQYSDVEFYIFLKNTEIEQFESSKWIRNIAPYDLLFFNEFGSEVVVFSNLIRGEFHFQPESEIEVIKTFKDTGVFPDTESMFIYDITGKLKACLDYLKGEGPERMTNENVNFAFNNFANAWLMGVNVLKRGEIARSAECLTYVQKYVLQLIRIREKNVERWLNATKNLEDDLSEKAYGEYASITSKVDKENLYLAYSNAINVGKGLVLVLSNYYQFDIDLMFMKKLNSYLTKHS